MLIDGGVFDKHLRTALLNKIDDGLEDLCGMARTWSRAREFWSQGIPPSINMAREPLALARHYSCDYRNHDAWNHVTPQREAQTVHESKQTEEAEQQPQICMTCGCQHLAKSKTEVECPAVVQSFLPTISVVKAGLVKSSSNSLRTRHPVLLFCVRSLTLRQRSKSSNHASLSFVFIPFRKIVRGLFSTSLLLAAMYGLFFHFIFALGVVMTVPGCGCLQFAVVVAKCVLPWPLFVVRCSLF